MKSSEGRAVPVPSQDLTERVFDGEFYRHRDNAYRALLDAKQHVDRLLADWSKEIRTGSFTHDARQAATSTAEAWAEIQAFMALHGVKFMITGHDPDEE